MYSIFPKDEAIWKDRVHEWAVSDLPVITLDGFIKHYSYIDYEHYISKLNLYSTISAYKYKEKNKKVIAIRDFILRPLFAFFKMYIIKRGFLEGWIGFAVCLTYANYVLHKYVKLKLLK